MAKSSHRSHVIIMQTAKLHATCAHNLGACAGKTDPDLESPEIGKQITEQWMEQLLLTGDGGNLAAFILPLHNSGCSSTQCEIDQFKGPSVDRAIEE